MTIRRRLLLFSLLAGLFTLGVGAWLLWPRTAITRENAAKIQIGMTLAEVEAILGGPVRNDATGPIVVAFDEDGNELGDEARIADFFVKEGQAIRPFPVADERGAVHHFGHVTVGWARHWLSDSARVGIVFDSADIVTEFRVSPMRRMQESPIDVVRRWLRL